MLLARIALLLLLPPVCGFSPGFFLLRRFRWNPLEKICGSIGLSLILLYLVSFAIYWVSPPGDSGDLVWKAAAWSTSAVCLVLAISALRDAARLARSRHVKRVLLCFLFLLIWTFAILSLIRTYSGGGWFGDWLEHFQRTLFFLHRLPPSTPIFPAYELPARPPMMNLLAAFFLAQAGDLFELFQITFTTLNLAVFLPCCWIATSLARPRTRRSLPWLLLALFALNPLLVQNATYTWTKLLTAFYVILGIAFYLAAWRKSDFPRMLAAFLALSAATLVHYSAIPYLLFVALHYLASLLGRRKVRWREPATLATAGGTLLATWFFWSILTYGLPSTFGSNTTAKSVLETPGSRTAKILTTFEANLVHTVVPHPFRSDIAPDAFAQPNPEARLRDQAFLIYQTNLILAMGLVGGPLVLVFWFREFWSRRTTQGRSARSETRFWFTLVLFCFPLGVAVNPGPDLYGVAHVTLQPLVLLGISFLAARLTSSSRWILAAAMLGCLCDFTFGILLHARIQNYENSPGRTVFPTLVAQDGHLRLGPGEDRSLSATAWNNWFRKHQFALSTEWLRELPSTQPRAFETAKKQLERYRWEDDLYFDGWYADHGGSLVFLGDDLAATPERLRAILAALILGALGFVSAAIAAAAPGSFLANARPGRLPIRTADLERPIAAG